MPICFARQICVNGYNKVGFINELWDPLISRKRQKKLLVDIGTRNRNVSCQLFANDLALSFMIIARYALSNAKHVDLHLVD